MKKIKLENINENPIVSFNNGKINLNVRVSHEEETVWMSQNDISKLFETTRQNVTKHIQNIFKEGELDNSVCKDFLHTADDGKQYKTKFYNLDMTLAIGYRIKGQRAIEFRKWVSSVMKDYIIKGYSLNSSRASLTDENYLRLCGDVLKLSNKIEEHESRINHLMPTSTIIYEGTPVSANVLLDLIISSTKGKLKIVDPYFDINGLLFIKDVSKRANVTIITSKRIKKDQFLVNQFTKVYGPINIVLDESIHDRFIIIDDEIIYQLGSSINQVGIKFSTLKRIENMNDQKLILERINMLDTKKMNQNY